MKQGVIFDLDGVIVSTDDLHYAAWKNIADKESIPFDETVNHRLRGVSRMESLDIILEKATKNYTDDEKIKLATEKNEIYRSSLESLSADDILTGVESLLHSLKQKNIRLAIGSSSKNAVPILQHIGLEKHFDVIVTGNDIRQSKPDPEVFLLAAERMQLASEACVVIEDAQAGIDAARAAGMKAVGVDENLNLQNTDWQLESLENLDVLKLLN